MVDDELKPPEAPVFDKEEESDSKPKKKGLFSKLFKKKEKEKEEIFEPAELTSELEQKPEETPEDIISNITSEEKSPIEEPPAFEEKDAGEIKEELDMEPKPEEPLPELPAQEIAPEIPQEEVAEKHKLDEEQMHELSSFKVTDEPSEVKAELDKVDEPEFKEAEEPDILKPEELEVKEPAKMEKPWAEEEAKEEPAKASGWADETDLIAKAVEKSDWTGEAPKEEEKPEPFKKEEVKEPELLKEVKEPKPIEHAIVGIMKKRKGKVKVEIKKVVSKPELDKRKAPRIIKEAKKELKKPAVKKVVKKPEVKKVKLPRIKKVKPKIVKKPKVMVRPVMFKPKKLSVAEVKKISQKVRGTADIDRFIATLDESTKKFRRDATAAIRSPREKTFVSNLDNLKQQLKMLTIPGQEKLQPSQYFVLADGTKLENITALLKALPKMNDAIFKYHVNDKKNDFANWIKGVMKEEELANKVDKYFQKSEILKVLKEYNSTFITRVGAAKKKRADLLKRIEKEEKKKPEKVLDFNQFARLHKASSLQSIIKLLQSLEYLYKAEYDEIIVNNKKEFARWLKNFVKEQRKAETLRSGPLKKELTTLLDKHYALIMNELKTKARSIAQSAKSNQELELKNRKKELELIKNMSSFKSEREKIIQDANAKVETAHKRYLNLENRLREKLQKDKEDFVTSLENGRKELAKAKEDFAIVKSKYEQELKERQDALKGLRTELDARVEQLKNSRKLFDTQKDKLEDEKKKLVMLHNKQMQELKRTQVEIEKKNLTAKNEFERLEQKHQNTLAKQEEIGLKNLRKEREKFETYKSRETVKLNKLRKKLQVEAVHLDNVKNELNAQEARMKHEIKMQRDEIKKDLETIKTIHQNMETMESTIRKDKEDMEKTGFQKYIEKKLSEIEPEAPSVSDEEFETDKDIERAEHLEFYQMIDKCQQLLRENKVKEAKVVYNELKDKFNTSTIKPSAKSTLYNTIRELYDDINLAEMD